MEKERNPLVTIIIPSLNSAGVIGECLESIKLQNYPNIEIIVVDGHSTDDTLTIAQKYGLTFSYGPDQSAGRIFGGSYQRNFGANKAKGTYIYYLDTDMRLTPRLIEECVTRIEEEGADAVIVPEYSYGTGFWSHCRVLEKSCYNTDDLVDAARFIRKDVWDKLGGLDANLWGRDDWDFQHRLNENRYKTIRVKNYVRHFEGNLRLWKDMKKAFVYGKVADRYLKKHRKHKMWLIKQHSLLRPAYIRNWRLLVKDPVHAAGFLLLKFLEYSSALAGILKSKISKTEVVLK